MPTNMEQIGTVDWRIKNLPIWHAVLSFKTLFSDFGPISMTPHLMQSPSECKQGVKTSQLQAWFSAHRCEWKISPWVHQDLDQAPCKWVVNSDVAVFHTHIAQVPVTAKGCAGRQRIRVLWALWGWLHRQNLIQDIWQSPVPPTIHWDRLKTGWSSTCIYFTLFLKAHLPLYKNITLPYFILFL